MGFPSAFLRWAALAMLAVSAACAPDIATDSDTPETLPFDPASDPPKIPQPTNLAMDPSTGLISFAVLGVHLPDDCVQATEMSQAQCEFYKYLESLDGFPTDLEATVPATAPVLLSSRPSKVLVVDGTKSEVVSDLRMRWNAATSQLAMLPSEGWDVGRTYHLGIRGYAQGIRSEQGRDFVASPPYFMFKQTEPLTCGATSAAAIGSCQWATLLAGPGITNEQIFKDLSDLEAIRVLYAESRLWDVLASKGMPKLEVAAAWSFPTHSASVIELNPTLEKLPKVVSSTQISLQVKGAVDAESITAFTLTKPGSVFLLDLTALDQEQPDLKAGIPPFELSIEGNSLRLKTASPMTDGHTMAILVTDAATGGGKPLVPAPMTALLKSRGTLLDEAGRSTVEGVSDDDAKQLEPARSDLGLLIDDPLFGLLTKLKRENIVYVYAFDFPNP